MTLFQFVLLILNINGTRPKYVTQRRISHYPI